MKGTWLGHFHVWWEKENKHFRNVGGEYSGRKYPRILKPCRGKQWMVGTAGGLGELTGPSRGGEEKEIQSQGNETLPWKGRQRNGYS